MDVHDIEPGRGWQERLEKGIEDGAAMLAIVTDEYSERAWCRRELREFRTPVCDEGKGGLWWLRPVFVLDALSGSRTRSMFEIGSAPTTRWQRDSAIAIIDSLVRDVLFGEVQRLRASRVPCQGVEVINWVPDTWTILELQRLMRPKPLSRIAYPGDGLPQLETATALRRVSGTGTAIIRGDSESMTTERPIVTFSAGDPPVEHLVRRGIGAPHVDDGVLRVARSVLRGNLDAAYAGNLRDGFTASLADDTGKVVIGPRFISFLGWPFSEKLTPAQVAHTLGLCRYVRVDPGFSTHGIEPFSETPDFGWAMARATTATRKLLFSRVSCVDVNSEAVGPRIAQILFAGKAFGFLGIMPGIAEEAMCALNANLAVYVVGAFGSAARLLAESLTTSELPDAFTHDSHESNAIFRRMLEGAKNAGCDDAPTEAFQKLQATLKTVGEDLNQLHNGLNGA
jgi:hypothetical protein